MSTNTQNQFVTCNEYLCSHRFLTPPFILYFFRSFLFRLIFIYSKFSSFSHLLVTQRLQHFLLDNFSKYFMICPSWCCFNGIGLISSKYLSIDSFDSRLTLLKLTRFILVKWDWIFKSICTISNHKIQRTLLIFSLESPENTQHKWNLIFK